MTGDPSTPPTPLPSALLAIEGTEPAPSMFVGGPALWANGTEILHADDGRHFDIRLTRQVIRRMKAQLVGDGRVRLRRSASSDWIEMEVATAEDERRLVELAVLAAEAHQPPPGAATRPLPDGAGLTRRRRFH